MKKTKKWLPRFSAGAELSDKAGQITWLPSDRWRDSKLW
jgi:hypothetical protein